MEQPINLKAWSREHSEDFENTIGSQVIQVGNEFFVMLIRGPNDRTDFHVNQSEEWFYQLEGTLELIVRNPTGKIEKIIIKEGEAYLLPAFIPHQPKRIAGTLGIVIERNRPAETLDILQWYCRFEDCQKLLHEIQFPIQNPHDLRTKLTQERNNSQNNSKSQQCQHCGRIQNILSSQ